MDNEEKKLFNSMKRATILSGIGMGLLLGIIMGLSVSEVVKVIFGVLTALLGAFLGFDRRSFAGMEAEEYEKEKHNTLFTSLRAGWFGLAVVAGILSGMWIRTHEIFTISVKDSVKQYTDAGFEPEYARKLVTYKRFAINPGTGELGEITEVQRAGQAALFTAGDKATLCGKIDPDLWNDDWQMAKNAMLEIDKKSLTKLVQAIELNVPGDRRFEFLRGLRVMVCEMNSKPTAFCKMGTDLEKWQNNEDTSAIATVVASLQPENQLLMMKALSAMVCQLEVD